MDQPPLDTSTRSQRNRFPSVHKPFRPDSLGPKHGECLIASASNYRVQISTGAKIQSMAQHCAVLDTGAGRNFIDLSQVPPDIRSRIEPTNSPAVFDANRNPLKVIGSVYLWVALGSYLSREKFVVCNKLAAPYILGCLYLNRNVKSIFPLERLVQMKNGSCARLLTNKQFSRRVPLRDRTSDHGKKSPHSNSTRKQGLSSPVRVCKQILVPAGCQVWTRVVTDVMGTCIIEPNKDHFWKHRVSSPNGTANVEANIPFDILVANFGRSDILLPKRMILAYATPTREILIRNVNLALENVVGVKFDIPSAKKETKEEIFTADNRKFKEMRPSANEKRMKEDIFKVEDLNLSHLSNKRQRELIRMLKEFQPMWDGHLGEINITKHRIELLPGTRPIRQHPYRTGMKSKEFEAEQIEKMLRDNVIRPSKSEWASPVVLAPKNDGTLRFCVDYRKLNEVTKKDSYPIPRMDDCIDTLGKAKVFSSLDANSGYWQIAVDEQDIEKTAFVCHQGLFEYLRMPFGLTNAPATFQRALDIALAGYKWHTCSVYLDDVIVFSEDDDEHITHLREILSVLKDTGMSLNLKKCSFFTKHIKYLGHIVRPGTIEVDKASTRCLEGLRPPRTITELRSFLGVCNVYRRFIRRLTDIAAPLNTLLEGSPAKNSPIPEFDERQRQSFETLKQAVMNPPVLSLPRVGLPYEIDTDACEHQIGFTLFQYQDRKRKPIGFWSRTLSPHEKNYHMTEKECLAIVYAIRTCRHYLMGEKFTVLTDHNSLSWLMKINDPSGRLMRWRLRLAEYNFDVRYKKGAQNWCADFASRMHTSNSIEVDEDHDEIPCYVIDTDNRKFSEIYELEHLFITKSGLQTQVPLAAVTREEVLIEQQSDPWCKKVKEKILKGSYSHYGEDEDGILVLLPTGNQIALPKTLRERVMALAHKPVCAAHPGSRKMYATLRRTYFWPTMALDCHFFLRNCPECSRERVTLRKHTRALVLFPANAPLESIAMDLLGPFLKTPRGNTHILVITDRYSKLTRTVPMAKTDAYSVAVAFTQNWVFTYGPPRSVLTDNGPPFSSKFLQTVCIALGVRNLFTTTYNPKANGQAERYNRTLAAALRAYVSDNQMDWDIHAPAITFAYNTQVHSTTGMRPFDLVLSRDIPSLTMEARPQEGAKEPRMVRERWLKKLQTLMRAHRVSTGKAQARYKSNFDRRLRNQTYHPEAGSYVYVRRDHTPVSADGERRSRKLAPRADGPYFVKELLPTTAAVQVGDRVEFMSLDRLAPAPGPIVVDVPGPSKSNIVPENERTPMNEYVVRRVVAHRLLREKGVNKRNPRYEYKVLWLEGDMTWEPIHHIPRHFITQYCRRKRLMLPVDIDQAETG